MNQKISVGEALGAGFRLIGREPLAVAVWCGAYFLSGAIPTAFSWGETQAVYAAMATGDMSTANVRWGPIDIISIIISLAFIIAMPAAVMRAVIYPDDRKFFYFRLGRRELWMALTMIILFVMWVVAYFGSFIAIGIVSLAGSIGGTEGVVVSTILALLVWLALMVGTVWAALRLSMAGVMAFADMRLRVFESWTFTKGQGVRMLLVSLAVYGIPILGFLVLVGVMVGSMAANTGGGVTDPMAQMFGQLSRISAPVALVWLGAMSVIFVGLYIISTAAWADMYRQLRPMLAETFD